VRDYGKLSPFFWTRGSGKRLRGDPDAQVVAAYLSTSPLANMIGVYYIALATIANDTGVALDDARKALGRIEKAGYAFYDFDAELVWIPNHARFEVGPTMAAGDKRRKKLTVELAQVGDHTFATLFLDAYGEAFGLEVPMVKPSSFPKQEGASENQEGASADREPIRSDPIRSDQGEGHPAPTPSRPGFVRIDLPVEVDVENVWGSRTMTREPGLPIGECWADFLGHFAAHDFGTRDALIGRWSKWVGQQCVIADKQRQAEHDRKDRQAQFRPSGPRLTEPAPAPYHRPARQPKSDEPAASPEQAAAAAKKIAGMFR